MLVVKQVNQSDDVLIPKLFELAGMDKGLANPRFFGGSDGILLVAYQEREPVGFLYGYVLESLNGVRPNMFLYSIDVFPGYKRKGTGTALVEKLLELAKKRNCREIFVLTNASNQSAMEFYRKTGGRRENDDDVMFVYPIE